MLVNQKPKTKKNYEHINPLPSNEKALKVLRSAQTECPVNRETDQLKILMDKIVNLDDNGELTNTLAEGIAIVMQADKFCSKQLKQRTVVTFEANESLSKIHDRINSIATELRELETQRQVKTHELQELLKKQWETSVKVFGLNPAERLYSVDDSKGEVQLLELECVGCKGATRIRKIRQKVAEQINEFGQKQEDTNDRGTTEKES